MNGEPLARRAAQWAAGLDLADVPTEVVEHAKLRILDVAGVLLAASRSAEARRALHTARELYASGEYPVVGFGERAGLAGAALVNGAMSAILEFDDTHIESAIHVTSPIVAAALPWAQAHGASGATLLKAVVTASELLCRIGLIGPRFHFLKFHPTGLLGGFGAVYGLAGVQGLPVETVTHAVGLMGSLAAGSMSSWDDGSDAKSLQPGMAAAAGVQAVLLAKNGLTGPSRIFESEFGFFRSHVQAANLPLRFEALTERLGERWDSLDIASKAYPSAFTIHPQVDAILALRAAHRLAADEVARIVCKVPTKSMNSVCEPVADKLRPRTPWHARISVQHMVAEALVTGVMDKDSMTAAHIRDPQINAVADRIQCIADKRFDVPDRSGGEVEVHTRDGRVLVHCVDNMRGTRANPIARADYLAKFARNAEGVVARAAADGLVDTLLSIEREPDLGRALAALHPNR